MSGNADTSTRKDDFIACAFLTFLSVSLALPSLREAWLHDKYSVGGWIAGIIWLISLAATSQRLRRNVTGSSMIWIFMAAVFCALGSITSLRVNHHLALVCALCGMAVPVNRAWVLVLGSVSWLPASGWFISRWFSGGLTGWERPAAAGLFGITWYLLTKISLTQAKHEI